MEENDKIIIVGAGVAGLVAAIELERRGLKPIIIESSDNVGGRVRTDYIDGFQLDHGFQVLLTAYPEAQDYLNYRELDLRYFDPGAEIYRNGSKYVISDPLRNPGQTLNMAFSPVGTLGDKFKIWKLSQRLKKTDIQTIFDKPSMTTLQYLKDF